MGHGNYTGGRAVDTGLEKALIEHVETLTTAQQSRTFVQVLIKISPAEMSEENSPDRYAAVLPANLYTAVQQALLRTHV